MIATKICICVLSYLTGDVTMIESKRKLKKALGACITSAVIILY